jgi:TonB family protein
MGRVKATFLRGTFVLLSLVCARADNSAAEVSRPDWDGGPPHVCWKYYPPEAKQANVEGTAQIAFIIQADGGVSDVHISQSSGSPSLDWASIACAQHWHYKPATRAGVPVAVEWTATIQFDPSRPSVRDDVDLTLPASDGPPHVCLKYYPIQAMQEGIQGMTTLSFIISEDGSVNDLKVSESSGSPLLDSATMVCAKTWRYIPAHHNGKPVAIPWETSVNYALR